MFEALFHLLELFISLLAELAQLVLAVFPWRIQLCLGLGLIAGILASIYLHKNPLKTAAFWTPAALAVPLGITWQLRQSKRRRF